MKDFIRVLLEADETLSKKLVDCSEQIKECENLIRESKIKSSQLRQSEHAGSSGISENAHVMINVIEAGRLETSQIGCNSVSVIVKVGSQTESTSKVPFSDNAAWNEEIKM